MTILMKQLIKNLNQSIFNLISAFTFKKSLIKRKRTIISAIIITTQTSETRSTNSFHTRVLREEYVSNHVIPIARCNTRCNTRRR